MRTARFIGLNGQAHFTVAPESVLLVGSHSSCDIRIDSRQVSRFHCCVSRIEDGVIIRDLESTNGTWINGRRVESGCLRSGDKLERLKMDYSAVGWVVTQRFTRRSVPVTREKTLGPDPAYGTSSKPRVRPQ